MYFFENNKLIVPKSLVVVNAKKRFLNNSWSGYENKLLPPTCLPYVDNLDIDKDKLNDLSHYVCYIRSDAFETDETDDNYYVLKTNGNDNQKKDLGWCFAFEIEPKRYNEKGYFVPTPKKRFSKKEMIQMYNEEFKFNKETEKQLEMISKNICEYVKDKNLNNEEELNIDNSKETEKIEDNSTIDTLNEEISYNQLNDVLNALKSSHTTIVRMKDQRIAQLDKDNVASFKHIVELEQTISDLRNENLKLTNERDNALYELSKAKSLNKLLKKKYLELKNNKKSILGSIFKNK